ncbi:hypothetical protein JVU11DRAFT_5992 [Chiua virens]|nr:hypothetical protein JVU11DRAFT_5992 [Chiua virens]
MHFLSTVQHGVYVEPAITGHSDDGVNLEAEIVAEQNTHIRHAAVDVPLTTSPFHTIQAFEVFRLAVQEAQE